MVESNVTALGYVVHCVLPGDIGFFGGGFNAQGEQVLHRDNASNSPKVFGMYPNAQAPGRNFVMCPPRLDDSDGSGCLLSGPVVSPNKEASPLGAFCGFWFGVRGALTTF